MDVSVALATFEGEAHLPEQLDSLARQTLRPAELVVNDDRSTDTTMDIIRAFAARAPFPVRLEVNERRLGFEDNFLRAALRCQSPLVAFCDQDDVWLERKLQRCAAALKPPGTVLAVHAGAVVDAALRPVGGRHPPVRRDRTLAPHAGSPWADRPGFAMVLRRELLMPELVERRPSSRFSDHQMQHDEWAWLWARLLGRTRLLAEPLALYRQHGANTAGAPDKRPGPVLSQALGAGSSTYTDFAALTSCYAAFLDEAAAAVPARRADIERGARTYAAIAANACRRARLYDGAAPARRRAGALLDLTRHGAYLPASRGGLGTRALVKDLALGLAAPSARRTPPASSR